MRNWKIQPENKYVANYIDCYWFLEKTQSDLAPQYPKLNPDPAAHLILSNPQQVYRYEQDSMVAAGKGSHLILPHSKTFLIDHSQPFLIIGIKFHVGALYSLRLPTQQPLLDQVISIDANNLLKSEIFIETDILTQMVDQPKLARNELDKLLMPFLLENYEDKHSKLVKNALAILSNTPISKMGDKLGCSQRTIERSFSRVTGLTLKQYQSMNKLEVMLNHLHTQCDKNISWADIATQFGFSDQPHLIRYLKNNIGHTPGEYIKQRNLTIDVYGDFE